MSVQSVFNKLKDSWTSTTGAIVFSMSKYYNFLPASESFKFYISPYINAKRLCHVAVDWLTIKLSEVKSIGIVKC